MNDVGWKTSRLKKTFFDFQLIPKHQQEKEIFACETEENRTVKKNKKLVFIFTFCSIIEMDKNIK